MKVSKARPLKRKIKQWHQIKSDQTKRRCLSDYKTEFFEILKQINGCHRCDMILWIGENRICLNWTPLCFETNEEVHDNVNTKGIFNDHTYADPNERLKIEEDYHDMEYSEIFDSNGQWSQSHIRCLIHVMDCFRVSNEAYHEIRMVSKGQLPPIGRIRKEKKNMSKELPYIKHPTVNLL